MDLIMTLIQLFLFPGFIYVLVSALMLMYFERKIIARIHMRRGPYYVGKAGILQTLADLLKLMFKEVIVPKTASKWVLLGVPTLMLILSWAPLAVIPYDSWYYVSRFNVSLLFVFAALSVFPFLGMLLGWGSGSKYSLIGGYRGASQQIAYELPLFLSALIPAFFAGSLDLWDIAAAQSKIWFGVLHPLAAILFFIAMLAELERIPFDIPEAESELVFGWKTDLSGIYFGFSIFAGYTLLFAESSFFVTLFLGGWNGPFLPGWLWFFIKVAFVLFIMFWIRAAQPRYRMDQLLSMGWKKLVPFAIFNIILGVFIMIYIVPIIGGI